VTWLDRLERMLDSEAPRSLRDTLADLCVPAGAPRAPESVTVQVHLVGQGATGAFWRIVTQKAAWRSVQEFTDFISATWGDDRTGVGFRLFAREEPRSLNTRVVVTTDGGELP
jgi:hypothetical protein